MPIVDYPFVKPPDHYSVRKPVLPVILKNPNNNFDLRVYGLIDTGADQTLVPDYMAKQLHYDIIRDCISTGTISGAGGEVEVFYHYFRIDILGMGQKRRVMSDVAIRIRKRLVGVVFGLPVMVFGENDFLKKYILKINYPRKIFSVRAP